MAYTPYVRPDVAQFLAYVNSQPGPKTHELSPTEGRAMLRTMRVVADADPDPIAVIKDLTCEGPNGPIPLRLYDARENREPGPAMVFFHGGGFVIGDLETHEPFCTRAAQILDMPIIAVDYRMAPEHVWPAAPQDCEAAARWVATSPAELGGRQVSALTLGGDSAGGNLTVVVAMLLRDAPATVPVIAQLPIYPATNQQDSFQSASDFAQGYLLSEDSLRWFEAHYAADVTAATASPGLFDLSGMPPAVVVTASLDPIRDQGRQYAGQLSEAGIDNRFIEAKGNIHGFICLRKAVPSSDEDVNHFLRAFQALVAEVNAPA